LDRVIMEREAMVQERMRIGRRLGGYLTQQQYDRRRLRE